MNVAPHCSTLLDAPQAVAGDRLPFPRHRGIIKLMIGGKLNGRGSVRSRSRANVPETKPDDPYKEWRWLCDAYPLVYGRLYIKLRRRDVDHEDAVLRAQYAVNFAFDAGARRMAISEYFPNYRAFVVWAILVGSHVFDDSLSGEIGCEFHGQSEIDPDTASVWESLVQLQPETRAAVYWAYLDELDDAEIAVGLDVDKESVATARTWIANGLFDAPFSTNETPMARMSGDRRNPPSPPAEENEASCLECHDSLESMRRSLEHRLLTHTSTLLGIMTRLVSGIEGAAASCAEEEDEEVDEEAVEFLKRFARPMRSQMLHILHAEDQSSLRTRFPYDAEELMNTLVNEGVASLDESRVFRLSVTYGCDENEMAERIDEQVPLAWVDAMERVGRELLEEHEQGRKRKIFTPSSDAESVKCMIAQRILREMRKH